MAVPTHSNNKSASVESMGVPVLFSIKNVQPLILAAKPTTPPSSTEPSISTQAASAVNTELEKVGGNGIAQSIPAPAPKARRTGMLSKVVATGFVVMLAVLVVRFSIPNPKSSSEVAGSDKPADTTVSEDQIKSIVTGPETVRSEDNTRVASLPTNADFRIGLPELKSPEPASPTVPMLPPLLSVSNTKDSASQASVPPSPLSLNPPVAPPEQTTAPTPGDTTIEKQSQSLEISSSGMMTSQMPSSDQAIQPPRENLHVVETLTPDRSLAEFESLFRNASKSPVIPYRPVSAGGHVDATTQPSLNGMPTSLSTPVTNPTGTAKVPSTTPSGYQPITIPTSNAVPPYEKGVPNQPLNRYTIRQPQKNAPADATASPAPYQPLSLPETVPSGSGSTNYGYPPVQYNPIPYNSGPNDPPKSNAGQQQ